MKSLRRFVTLLAYLPSSTQAPPESLSTLYRDAGASRCDESSMTMDSSCVFTRDGKTWFPFSLFPFVEVYQSQMTLKRCDSLTFSAFVAFPLFSASNQMMMRKSEPSSLAFALILYHST